jgi:hypothetical protein
VTLAITRPVALAFGAAVMVVVATFAVVHRHAEVATVPVAPLSATDRQALVSSRSLVESLPEALAQVPTAASDAARGQVSVAQARRLLDRTRALSALSAAVADPTSVTEPLTDAYDAVVAGRPSGSVVDLVAALQQLQTVEGQIEPAIRLVAAHGGVPPTAAATVTTIAVDHRVTVLAHLVAGWQRIYGTFILVEQSAAS